MAAFAAPFGHYQWSYAGGTFGVDLRPSGVFYCSKFPAVASFTLQDNNAKCLVNWGSFGNYELTLDNSASTKIFNGHKVGEPANWRKMEFSSPFTAEEEVLMGNGGGSVWGFQWEKGEFEIELRCDAYNHFVCKEFPAHSHWTCSITPDNKCKVDINWGKYGEYEMVLAGREMIGNKKGQPANWRKAYLKSALSVEALASGAPAHDHSHAHDH